MSVCRSTTGVGVIGGEEHGRVVTSSSHGVMSSSHGVMSSLHGVTSSRELLISE